MFVCMVGIRNIMTICCCPCIALAFRLLPRKTASLCIISNLYDSIIILVSITWLTVSLQYFWGFSFIFSELSIWSRTNIAFTYTCQYYYRSLHSIWVVGVRKFDQVSIMGEDSKSNMATALNSFIFSQVSLACFYYISPSFHLCHSLRGFQ